MGERVVSQSIDLSNLTNSSDIQQQINKYITRIDNMGITIHPENVPIYSNYIQIDGNGFTIKETNSNDIDVVNDILLASFQSNGIDFYGMPVSQGAPIHTNIAHLGGNTRIGALNSGHTTISYAGISFNNGTNTYGSINYNYQDINDIEITSYSIEGQLTSTFNYRTNKYMNINKECNATIEVSFLNGENETITLNTDTFDAYHNYSQILTYTNEIEVIPDHTITETYNINFSYEPELGFTTNYSRLYFNLNTTVNNDEKDFTITIYLEFSSPVDPPHFGFGTTVQAIGTNAFAVGNNTIALGNNQFVSGKYNQPDENALFIIGNGINNDNRSNLFVVDGNGNLVIKDGFKIINNTGNYLQLNSDSIKFYDRNNGLLADFGSNGIIIGKTNKTNIQLTDTELKFYTEGNSIASYGSTIRIGPESGQRLELSGDGIGAFGLDGNVRYFNIESSTGSAISHIERQIEEINDPTSNITIDLSQSDSTKNVWETINTNDTFNIRITWIYKLDTTQTLTAPLPPVTTKQKDINFTKGVSDTTNTYAQYVAPSTLTITSSTVPDMGEYYIVNKIVTLEADTFTIGPVYQFCNNRTSSNGAFTFMTGNGLKTDSNYQTAIGQYNYLNYEDYPDIEDHRGILFVGAGNSNSQRKNAIVVTHSDDSTGYGSDILIGLTEYGSNQDAKLCNWLRSHFIGTSTSVTWYNECVIETNNSQSLSLKKLLYRLLTQ